MSSMITISSNTAHLTLDWRGSTNTRNGMEHNRRNGMEHNRMNGMEQNRRDGMEE